MEGKVIQFARKTREPNQHIIEILKESLHAAEQGKIASIGIAYISDEGNIVQGSEGSGKYNTALMGGLMSLSISLGQST
jgi:hypothetical protein